MASKLHLRIEDLATIESMSPNQYKFLENYHKYPVHLLHGFAGTGKSFLATYRALEDVLDKGTPYEHLIFIRSPIGTTNIGALPGDLVEKGSPFEEPFYYICNDLFPKDKGAYEKLKSQGLVSFRLCTHLKGVTFDGSIVVVDEIQNMKYNELYNIITRVGYDSKIIFCGDTRQNDISGSSGLPKFKSRLDRMKSVHQVNFDKYEDIVRGDIVKEFIIADSEYESNI